MKSMNDEGLISLNILSSYLNIASSIPLSIIKDLYALTRQVSISIASRLRISMEADRIDRSINQANCAFILQASLLARELMISCYLW